MRSFLLKLRASCKGATAVEYALIISFVVLAMVSALSTVAQKTNSMWANISNEVSNH